MIFPEPEEDEKLAAQQRRLLRYTRANTEAVTMRAVKKSVPPSML